MMRNAMRADYVYLHKGTKSLDVTINTFPHYSDRKYRKEQTEFCSEPDKLIERHGTLVVDGLHYDYSDRLCEWDRKKFNAAYDHADSVFNTTRKDWEKRATARYIQEFLRFYYGDKDLELVHVIAGINKGNGYPYLVYGTRRPAIGAQPDEQDTA